MKRKLLRYRGLIRVEVNAGFDYVDFDAVA